MTLKKEQNLTEHPALSERVEWLDVMKGIGIILVVLGHVYKNEVVFHWIYCFHMPLFFWVSGYAYKRRTVGADIRRRIQTILIPYFSFGIMELIYWQLFERRFRPSDLNFKEAVKGLLGGWFDYLDFNVQLWFLPCFFLSVVLFNVLNNYCSKKGLYIFSILMAVVFIVLPLPVKNWLVFENRDFFDWPGMPSLPWGINRIFRFFGFLTLGNLAFEKQILQRYIFGKEKRKSFLCFLAMLIVTFGISYSRLYLTGIWWYVAAICGITGTAILAENLKKIKSLQYLGKISLVVLCIHGPVYRILAALFAILLHTSSDCVRENFVLTVTVVILTLILCALAYEIIKRAVPWMIGKNKTEKMKCMKS